MSIICERINSNVDADPNANLNILTNIINSAKNIPHKVKNYNQRRDNKEPWMTNELLLMVNRKNELYVDWKSTAKHSEN